MSCHMQQACHISISKLRALFNDTDAMFIPACCTFYLNHCNKDVYNEKLPNTHVYCRPEYDIYIDENNCS